MFFFSLTLLICFLVIYVLSFKHAFYEGVAGEIIVGIVLWWWFFTEGFYESMHWIGSNFLLFLGLWVVYFIIGGGWSIIKWKLFLRKYEKVLEKGKVAWQAHIDAVHAENAQPKMASSDSHVSMSLEDKQTKSFSQFYREWNSDSNYPYPFKVSKIKSKFAYWISAWWFSFVETFLGDFVLEIVNHIYNACVTLYQRMLDDVYKRLGLTEN